VDSAFGTHKISAPRFSSLRLCVNLLRRLDTHKGRS